MNRISLKKLGFQVINNEYYLIEINNYSYYIAIIKGYQSIVINTYVYINEENEQLLLCYINVLNLEYDFIESISYIDNTLSIRLKYKTIDLNKVKELLEKLSLFLSKKGCLAY